MNILVTGSGKGIGKFTALKLADMGYHVILHARNQGCLEETVKMMEENVKALKKGLE